MAAATNKQIKERIVAINATVTGVSRAYENIHRKLDDSMLKEGALVVTFPGAVKRTRKGGAVISETPRQWQIQVFVSKITGSTGAAQGAVDETGVLDAFYEAYDRRPQLELEQANTGIVGNALLSGDDGLQLLEFPFGSGNFYLGYVFTLETSRLTVQPLRA